jgi:hypothetical protein
MSKEDFPNLRLMWWALAVSLFSLQPAQAGLFRATGAMKTGRGYHTATLLVDGKVLVAGGSGTNQLGSAELYDPATGVWALTGPLNKTRDSHTATLLPNGKVLVAGGGANPNGGGWRSIAGCEVYDPTTGTWTLTGALNIPRDGHAANLLPNGKVLVTGGESYINNNQPTLDVAELYDPNTGIWTLTGTM